MATRDAVPSTGPELVIWFLNLASKIDKYAAVLTITAEDIASLKADAAMVDWTFKTLNAVRPAVEQFTAFKRNLVEGEPGGAPVAVPVAPVFSTPPPAVPDGVVPRTRALLQRIKKSPGYTEAIGKDLGIIAPAPAADDHPKPTFRAVLLPNWEVRLDWMKARHSGVVIQCKRAGDADWVGLGRDNYSPYVDGRPPVTAGASESRQYRMRYFDKDDEVGDWSDIVTAVATA